MATVTAASGCCHCGLPLQQSTQLVGLFDVLLGGLNVVALGIHIKEEYEYPDPSPNNSAQDDNLIMNYWQTTHGVTERSAKPLRTFKNLDVIPIGLAVTILICHVIQMVLGILLCVVARINSSPNRKRALIEVWLTITGFTALFTGFFIRIYEMIIVNDYARELLREGRNHSEPASNSVNPNDPERCISTSCDINHVHGSTGPSPVHLPNPNTQQRQQPPAYQTYLKYDSHKVPEALEPPPSYEDVMNEKSSSVAKY